MIDAERLLRLRGLPKRKISPKARLLHHIYTWIRIVGESTYILHDYNPSDSFLEAFNHHFRTNHDAISQHNPRLDDFLRLQPRQSDSDLDIDEPKDMEVGLHDIHLQDSRKYSETLYNQIYGIPETWLSLVSQTTRMANVLDCLRIARRTHSNLSTEGWDTVQRRRVRLENMICSFDLTRARGGDNASPHDHMLRALNSALVIFFYRRIRQVHPAILQGHVDSVITALRDYDNSLVQWQHPGPGTAWPAFMAGCEAITTPRREAILQWVEKGGSQCGFAAFTSAREVMMEVWKRQDGHLSTRGGEGVPTWVEVVKDWQMWPIFC